MQYKCANMYFNPFDVQAISLGICKQQNKFDYFE